MARRNRRRRLGHAPKDGAVAKLLEEARRAPSSGSSYLITPDAVRKLIREGRYTPERACNTKARFGQYPHAAQAREDIQARHNDGQTFQIYPCPFCGGFHLATDKEFER
jgi:hypothetical protein